MTAGPFFPDERVCGGMGSASFSSLVYRAVRQIPAGKVATYGQIARLTGHPGAARAVGNALHHNPDEFRTPCFRVVNAQGYLSGAFAFGGINEQRDRLRADGTEVVNYRVDLKKYQWDGSPQRDE